MTIARAEHQQWTMLTLFPSTGNILHLQMSVIEAVMKAESCNSCLPERVQMLAIQKNVATISDVLFLTFQILYLQNLHQG